MIISECLVIQLYHKRTDNVCANEEFHLTWKVCIKHPRGTSRRIMGNLVVCIPYQPVCLENEIVVNSTICI